MKKSFLMYHDACTIFDELTNEDAGLLIKEVVKYSMSKTQSPPVEPSGLSGLLGALSIQFKNQIDRDLENYLKVCERNKKNGIKGGRKKKKTQSPPVAPDKDKDKDKDKDNKKEKIKEKEIYDLYPRKIGGAKAIESITKALTKISYEELREKVKTYAEQSKETEPQFIPHPSTWFNQERWLDVQQIKNNKVFLNLI